MFNDQDFLLGFNLRGGMQNKRKNQSNEGNHYHQTEFKLHIAKKGGFCGIFVS